MTSWEFSKPSWLPQPAHFSLMKHISSHFPHTQSIFCFYHHYLLSPTSSASVLFLLKGSLATQFKLAFNSPCSLRWPQLTVNPSASASWVLGLQALWHHAQLFPIFLYLPLPSLSISPFLPSCFSNYMSDLVSTLSGFLLLSTQVPIPGYHFPARVWGNSSRNLGDLLKVTQPKVAREVCLLQNLFSGLGTLSKCSTLSML